MCDANTLNGHDNKLHTNKEASCPFNAYTNGGSGGISTPTHSCPHTSIESHAGVTVQVGLATLMLCWCWLPSQCTGLHA